MGSMSFMKSKYSIVITIVFGIFLITLSGIYLLNKRKTPIKIGFIADFTTGGSDLAIQGRNGALLAINKINKSGGFKGRKFELITETNHNNKELCRAAVSSLLDKNVSLIVGPMLSSMASSVLDATKDQNILVISPGVSGNRYYNTE
ncbi:MAG: hypothetical protein B6229_06460 [Spirochaetaceae bacterium 4572_7]|nr:MAG: hypothetical protein B6229_06460 [Spirochaetaceae bacterium 4572_7]